MNFKTFSSKNQELSSVLYRSGDFFVRDLDTNNRADMAGFANDGFWYRSWNYNRPAIFADVFDWNVRRGYCG